MPYVTSVDMLKSTTPKKVDPLIKQLLDFLDVEEADCKWLKFRRETAFLPEQGNCHINNMIKCKLSGGEIIYGWVIWQDKIARFVEAEFHSVWKNGDGDLVDITPRKDGEKRILFVSDPTRIINLTDHEGDPAICTYGNVCMVDGVIRGLQRQIHVLNTNLIYEYGLAVRSNES